MSILKIVVSAAVTLSVLAAVGCSSNQPTPQAAAAPMAAPAAPPDPVVAAAPMQAPMAPMAPDAPTMAAAANPAGNMDTTMVAERAPRADRN
jgi:hypothetical protein